MIKCVKCGDVIIGGAPSVGENHAPADSTIVTCHYHQHLPVQQLLE